MLFVKIWQPELRNAAVLIFANKQDLPQSMAVSEIAVKLGLHTLSQRRWYASYFSCIQRFGIFFIQSKIIFLNSYFPSKTCLVEYFFLVHQHLRWEDSNLKVFFFFFFEKKRYIQGTSATSGQGLYEGFDWLCNNIPIKDSPWF